MANVNTIGMILYLLLAIFGGFLSGLFSRYAYQAAVKDFGKLIALLCSVVFYVPPVWAFFSLFKADDLDVFYLLLIASFIGGIYYYRRIAGEQDDDQNYYPPD
ncbi:hypothetical protein [Methylophaga sp. OBS4]|uniref:hypothetical protein n=1 Tax=Methylophaga sp. OBS4 TaxID=2991935 RepID=UPI002250DE6D|nr:hypothetical protein [Methylophaga sp. OBS4]MCX4186959.1 hypothetical protein [Methylophaga sp. OBS4]